MGRGPACVATGQGHSQRLHVDRAGGHDDVPLRQRGEPSLMTATAHTRPVVSVDELQRAWLALQSGEFRGAAQPWVKKRTPPHTSRVWTASPGEQVLSVVRCPGARGATTFALALATAAKDAARVVECSAPTSSGLAAASTT